ncbi:MAG: RdgB/HAM1 family non-canonical purine NTP pyrophosphatase [Flavobacteriales bacterium]
MKSIVFASANENKVKEIQHKLGGHLHIQGLKEIGCHEEIPEEQDTLEGNARQKAWYIWNNYKVNCFADDTGLEVYALGMQPGVFSARYAGDQKKSADNIALLLKNMETIHDRRARFRTVICLIENGVERLFEGIAEGTIQRDLRGADGFGYDPIFVPLGNSRTFAEMSMEEKNIISHRAKAIGLLRGWLG